MIADRIKELRNLKRISQNELAKHLQVSQQTIGAWEVGRTEPSIEFTNKMADYFDVSADYLLGRTNVRKPQRENDNQDPIDKMLDEVMSYDGEKPTENDREILRGIIEAYLKNKK